MIRAIAPAIVVLMAAAVFAQNTPPLTHHYAEINGVRLHYAQAGRGPLMVFLHGFPEFWYEWKNQIPEFARDHTVVAPDMRGYNLSSKPAELSAYEMPALVEDVRALVALIPGTGLGRDPNRDLSPGGLGVEINRDRSPGKFTLVAHDWGGVVAWVFAAMHPEMVDRLIIINAPHPTIFGRELRENPLQQKASQYMLMFRGPAAEATLAANDYGLLTSMVLGAGLKDGSVTEVDKALYVAAWSQPGALTGGLNYYRAAGIGPPSPSTVERPGAPPSREAAPATTPPAASRVEGPMMVRVPTLVIWGDRDTALLTGNLTGLDAVVPALTVKHIPDATHWVVREKPDEVNRLIREFIARP